MRELFVVLSPSHPHCCMSEAKMAAPLSLAVFAIKLMVTFFDDGIWEGRGKRRRGKRRRGKRRKKRRRRKKKKRRRRRRGKRRNGRRGEKKDVYS